MSVQWRQSFVTRHNVPNGTYRVRFHWAETFFTYSYRLFDVYVEGVEVFNHLDVFTQSGGANRALVLESDVEVSDGALNVSVQGYQDSAIIEALEIVPLGDINSSSLAIRPNVNKVVQFGDMPLVVAPNPVLRDAEVISDVQRNGLVDVQIFDLSGARVFEKSFNASGASRLRIPLALKSWPSGVYVAILLEKHYDGTSRLQSFKFAVVH